MDASVGVVVGNSRLVEEAKSFENEVMVRRKGLRRKMEVWLLMAQLHQETGK